MSSASSVLATLTVPASGGVVVSVAAGSGVGSAGAALAVGVGSSAALAEADADGAGFGPFFLAFGALCAKATGPTAKMSRATVAKKECRCRPRCWERAMENLGSARSARRRLVARAMLHYGNALWGSAYSGPTE